MLLGNQVIDFFQWHRFDTVTGQFLKRYSDIYNRFLEMEQKYGYTLKESKKVK